MAAGAGPACVVLCAPPMHALEIFGTVLTYAIAIGWFVSGLSRRREIWRRRKPPLASSSGAGPIGTGRAGGGGSSSPGKGPPGLPKRGKAPGVSVIMPVKGCREHSVSNWISQLTMQYGGAMEFIFAVEDKHDAAFATLHRISSAATPRQPPISIIEAGQATTCSQKIHNQLAAVAKANPKHKYALFLDDDVQLHETTLDDLVRLLESDDSLFMATGYPHDIVTETGSFFSHCIATWHHILGIGASANERHMFVWGGCMLVPLKVMREDGYGISSAFRDGGYSDDWLMVTSCKEHGLNSICPFFAVFPQRLGKSSLRDFWNYARRQTFVLDTYRSVQYRSMNLAMLLVIALLGVALPFSFVSALARLVHWAATGSSCACGGVLQIIAAAIPKVWLGGFVLCNAAFFWMRTNLEQLFAALSPHREHPKTTMSLSYGIEFWGGFYFGSLVFAAVGIMTPFMNDIVWSGITYRKSKGLVSIVKRVAQ